MVRAFWLDGRGSPINIYSFWSTCSLLVWPASLLYSIARPRESICPAPAAAVITIAPRNREGWLPVIDYGFLLKRDDLRPSNGPA
jgi:hypothetical protein